MIVDIPRMGTGIKSVFNGGPMSVIPVSGRLNVGAKNIMKLAKVVQQRVSNFNTVPPPKSVDLKV